ncbi:MULTISPECIES: hypothetical protein [unclassified Streptomyces]|uniref:hypothetical protein n=1 Tax=unclassified Streptomyces TaxID=2593676 RepID=UPI002E16B987|nr:MULTISPECIES: hypothetical protein [unclassified Streptomyces]
MKHTPDTTTGNTLDALLATAHQQLEVAVNDRLMAEGGIPELRDPDLALDRRLGVVHRTVGSAVTARLARHTPNTADDRTSIPGMSFSAASTLANQPPAVRLKHRSQALELVRVYWPRDLSMVLQACLRLVADLAQIQDEEELEAQVHHTARRLGAHFDEILGMRYRHRRTPSDGPEYLASVDAFLVAPARQLLYEVHSAQQMLGDAPEHFLGVSEVVQDLADDLEQAHRQAKSLSRAVAEVEKASNNFIGADLGSADLEGVLLKGIRWDADTCWPQQWETLIRRASLPAVDEDGVLIVIAEPCDSAVPADA